MATLNIKPEHKSRVRWLLGPVIAFLLVTTLACRVQIGFGAAAAAPVKLLPSPTLTSNPLPRPSLSVPAAGQVKIESSPTSVLVSPSTPTPTPPPTLVAPPSLPAPTPTATPQPTIPAQAPPTRLIIPAINLDTPVEVAGWTVKKEAGVETSTWNVPDKAAGWHQNSALPGNGGNVVLSGHHNIGAEVFRYLIDLKKGDEIFLQADGRTYRYRVTDHFILPERGVSAEQRQQNVQWIMPTTDERLTLVTCWPYTGNSHRLIVIAK